MKVGPLFNKIMSTPEKIIVLQGGGDAGKTVSALQAIGCWTMENKDFVTTVVGQDVPNIKVGSLRAFQRYVVSDPEVQSNLVSSFSSRRDSKAFHKTDRQYTFYNDSIVEFRSFADEQDARGGERDILFVNEANFINYKIFWQLYRKTRFKVIVDYNPTSRFWVHDKLLPGDTQEKQYRGKVRRYIVDHRHNPFLTEEDHMSYENLTDPEMFRVYARGLTGMIHGLIFGHIKKADAPPEVYDRIFWGIDYGYTNDPTALLKIWAVGNKRYAKELCYTPGLTASRIHEILHENGYDDNQPIYSEHDTDMINQLILKGVTIFPAMKSVIAGISKVKEYECYYIDSPNFANEILLYKWIEAQDIITGADVMTNIPVDAWNHCCDAFRYGCYTDFMAMRGETQ